MTTDIRVADANASQRFTALNACKSQMVSSPPTVQAPDRGVVRIIGVKVRPESRHEEPVRTAPSAIRTTSAYDPHVLRTAAAYRIDPLFLHAVIGTESAYRSDAVSHAGAVGLMQIMPATGRGLGVDTRGLRDPATNIDAGARHLKKLQRRYGRNFDLILSAYNAGEGAVARYGNRIPPYRETQDYVGRVMRRYEALRGGGTGYAK